MMALQFVAKRNGNPLPPEFEGRKFRSYVDMATFADEHKLPDGTYFIRNDKGANLLTGLRELTRKGSGFHVEGRGNV